MIKNINNNKILMISHIADIDGMGSVILAKKYYKNIDYILCEVKELPDVLNTNKFDNYEIIYLCDLPLIPSAIEVLNNHKEITSKLKHFDHHIPNGEFIPDYVNSVIELNNRKTCGTELFYNYLLSLDNSLNNPFYKTYVEATREHDTWDFNIESYNAKLLASTHALIGPEAYIDLICTLDDSKEFKIPELFDNLYKSDLEKQNRYIENINNNLLITDYNGYKIGITIAEQYISFVGATICKLRPELDFVMILNYSKNSVSLRCAKDNIDLSQVCLEFHHDGGGHKKAAGFAIDSESIPKIEHFHNMYLENLK